MKFEYKRRDASTIKKRAEQRGGGEFEKFILDEFTTYAVRKGSNSIRILPPTWDDPDHYGLDIFVHYGIGPQKVAVLCPISNKKGSRCPVCEARARAERQGDEELKNQLRVTKRVMYWIEDREKERKDGAQVYAAPWTLDRDISKVSVDKRTGEHYMIDDPESGFDVYFDKEGEMQLTKYSGVQLARTPSSVDEKLLEYISRHPLPGVLKFRSYDEIKAIFEGDEDSDATPPPRRPSPRPSETEAFDTRSHPDEETPWEPATAVSEPARHTPSQEPPKAAQPASEGQQTADPVAALREKLKARKEGTG